MPAATSPSNHPDPFADRRASPRVELALPAFLKVGEERYSVKLLDLSNGGAKLTCPVQLPQGATVVLDCGSFCLSGEVRWQNAAFLGLCFETELDAREVAALVARSRALTARMIAQG